MPVLGGDERLVLENAFAPEQLPDGSLLVVRKNAERQFQLHRFWPGTGHVQALALLTAQNPYWVRVRALPAGTAAVVWGEPLGQSASSPGFYLADLDTGSTRRLHSQGVEAADANTSFAVSPDGTSVIAAAHAGALTTIFRFPLSGTDVATPLLTVTGTVWFLDAGPAGSYYVGMVDRPVDVVRFAPDGSGVERLASFPSIPDLSTMTVLPDGRAVVPVRASSRVRLMAVQRGKDPAPLMNTADESGAPVAACGSREVALMIGPEPRETIGFAEPASGRWSVPSHRARGRRIRGRALPMARRSISRPADPSDRRLIVQVQEGSKLHRFSVPLDGEPEQEIATDTSIPLAPIQLSPNALRADGRLLTSLLPRDSWFNPPAVVDTLTGRVTPIPSENRSDYQSIGWTPDGQVMALKTGLRATLWKFEAALH